MKTYIFNLIGRWRQFSQELDVQEVLCSHSWNVINDDNSQEILIFKRDGELVISTNGNTQSYKWQYFTQNNSLLINHTDIQGTLLKPAFVNEKILIFKKDGTNECMFLVEEKYDDKDRPNSIETVKKMLDALTDTSTSTEQNMDHKMAPSTDTQSQAQPTITSESEQTCHICKATGIPVSAKYCPTCGASLINAPSPWNDKRTALEKERYELLEEKHQLENFKQRRENMLSGLKNDKDYETAMIKSRQNIQQNEERKRKQIRIFITFIVIIVFAFIALIYSLNTSSPEWLHWCLGIIIICSFFIILVVMLMNDEVCANKYIQDIYAPFVASNIQNYRRIYGYGISAEYVLQKEIKIDEESVTSKISKEILNLDNLISKIDNQIKLYETLI